MVPGRRPSVPRDVPPITFMELCAPVVGDVRTSEYPGVGVAVDDATPAMAVFITLATAWAALDGYMVELMAVGKVTVTGSPLSIANSSVPASGSIR